MTLFARRRRALAAALALVATVATLSLTPSSWACSPGGLTRKLQKALAQGNIAKACRIINQWLIKLTGRPLPPLAGMPTAAQCAMAGVPQDNDNGGGRGRGGGMGGGGSGGGSAGGLVYTYNSASPTGCYNYTVTPDPGNPPGFTVVGGSGFMSVPLGGVATAPFSVSIAPGTPVGTMGLFKVQIVDCGNGLPLPDTWGTVKITVLNNLKVDITQIDFRVIDGAPSTTKWRVTNLSASARTVNYTYTVTDDPGSTAELNGGAPFPIHDTFSTPRAAMGGGSASLAAAGNTNDHAELTWDMMPGEYCEPGMLGCCALVLDGVTVGDECFVNTANTGARCCMPADTYYIQGTSSGGSALVDIGPHALTVPLGTGVTPLALADTLTTAINNHASTTDLYNFGAAPLGEELMLMFSGVSPVITNLRSNDPAVFFVKLPQYMPLNLFNTTPHPTNPRALRSKIDRFPDVIDTELTMMSLTAVAPIQIVNPLVISPNDLSTLRTSNGNAAPILPPGGIYGASAMFTLTSPTTPPLQISGPITVDLSPLSPSNQAFSLRVPVTIGAPVRMQLELFVHVRPTAQGAAPNPVPTQLFPGSITAMQIAANQFTVQYQAQTPVQTFSIKHELITQAGAQMVPAFCGYELGDVNADLQVTGLDIPEFVAAVIMGATAQQVPCAEFVADGFITSADIPGFVVALLN